MTETPPHKPCNYASKCLAGMIHHGYKEFNNMACMDAVTLGWILTAGACPSEPMNTKPIKTDQTTPDRIGHSNELFSTKTNNTHTTLTSVDEHASRIQHSDR